MTRYIVWCVVACIARILAADESADPALVAHYNFAEGQGDMLLDHSGNQHHGRIIGAQWEKISEHWALRFDGSGDYVDFGDNRALKRTGDFTMLAWVTLDAPAYPDGTTNWSLFDCEAYPTEGTILRVDGAAATVLFRSSRAGVPVDRFGKARMANRGCYLIGVVRAGERARIIVDGVTDVDFAVGGDPIYGDTSFKISSPAQSFAGLIHEARIYSRALGAAEIAAHYWRGAPQAGKDLSRQGQLPLRVSAYADDPEVLADVDFLGVLPLAAGEHVVVSLTRTDGTPLGEQVVDPVPDTCQGEYVFDMAGQAPGQYAVEAHVRGKNAAIRAIARRVFTHPVNDSVSVPSPRMYRAPELPAPPQRLKPTIEVLRGGGFCVGIEWDSRAASPLPRGRDRQREGQRRERFSSGKTRRGQRGCGRQTAGAPRMNPISGEIGHKKSFTALREGAERASLDGPHRQAGEGIGIANESLTVESSFSIPNSTDVQLVTQPSAVEHVTVDGTHVTLDNRYYRLDRDIEVQAELGRILVRDAFANLTAEPVGVILTNRLAVESARLKDVYLAGRTVMKPTTRSLKTSPTVFARLDNCGIGLVALDDVFIVQSLGSRTEDGVSLGSAEFALAAHATYTMEWAVYVNATGDYYDFVNDVRADEKRNQTTVEGTWVSPGQLMSKRILDYVPPPSYFDLRRPAYFCIPCLSWCADDSTVSLEGIEFAAYPRERAAVRQVLDAVAATRPQLKTMFHIAPNLYATNQPDLLWPDSRLIGPDGKQTVYAHNYESGSYFTKERIDENWRWWSYYPAVDNAYGQALLDSVDVMMDEMGASGAFVDGALWDYGGAYSYDRFDGHTADIDPGTKAITRLKTAVPLLQQHAVAAWGRKIMERGGAVVINNALPTRTFAGQPFIFDREITEGPEMHLFSTPCTLGNPYGIQTETDVYVDVLAKLSWGNLYFYYGEPLAMQHELPPARMYPITVTDIRSGCVTGRERVVTALDGVYGWPGDRCLHWVYRYDRRGRRIGHEFITTIDPGGARTVVDLDLGEMAIVVKLPVIIDAATPVNAIVTRCDEQAIDVVLNGVGTATITGPDGKVLPIALDGQQELTICPGSAG